MNESDSIVEMIRKDRRAGAARLVAEYKDRLYGVAYGLCGNVAEAEDLVFRTFEQVIAKIDGYCEEEAFFGWMHTILLNYYRMSVRGSMAKNTVPSGGLNELDGLSGAVGPETVIASLDGDILRQAVESLPKEMREVVVLHYFMDQPLGKIAKMLSIAKGTVKSRLHYARLMLGVRLGVVLRKPTAALIAVSLFLAATVATAAFVAAEPAVTAEVDEPIFLDDAPLVFEDGFQDEGGCAVRDAATCTAEEGRCVSSRTVIPADVDSRPPATVIRAKVSVSRSIRGFRSCCKAVRSRPLPSFSSTAANPVVVVVR